MVAMRRGQEEAPIELLIGVVILTFVIIVGFYTYQNMCGSQFEQKMKASLAKFANDLETLNMGYTGTIITSELDFLPIGCAGEVDSVRLFKGTSDMCMSHTNYEDCLILTLVARAEGQSGTIIIAEPLNIRSTTTILHEPFGRTDPDQCITTTNAIGDIQSFFEGQLSGFSQGECYMWSMSEYSLVLEKTASNQITISG
jgi:hypothetical protein